MKTMRHHWLPGGGGSLPRDAGSSDGSRHMRRRSVHASARVGRKEKGLMAEGRKKCPDNSGMVRVLIELLEVNKSDFENIKSKNFKNGVDPGLKTARGG